jgi:hypothetical protein
MIHVRHTHNDIEHPDAYDKAVRNYIKANAATTRQKNWFAAHPDAQRLRDWLYGDGEFESRFSCGLASSDWRDHRCAEMDRCCSKGAIAHPACRGIFAGDYGSFLLKLREALEEWGGLTDKQTEALRKALARAEERIAKAAQRREEKLEADRAGSTHVGAVGERREFSVLCERSFSFEGVYGVSHINICRDEAANVIVYKGSHGLEKGWRYVIKATVKAHDEREGVKQTIIARPKILSEKESDL